MLRCHGSVTVLSLLLFSLNLWGLQLYGSMDELGVRLDEVTLDVTLEALDQLGAHGHAEQLREQYSAVRSEWRYTNGQRRQVNSFGRPREGQKI